ncbi:MAG: maltose alpha-D-glucosyltransferase [Gemmatimonadota bacterium]|nr:MAG: maltose alpha-D-glucosyltransferase [Gemmatimonadota bacterium]
MSGDSLWYKDAIIYQVHVRAFYDSDGDGIGDFRGLTDKLEYLEDLGVTTIWLQPFYPSPLRDDGYDIADYRDIHPDYGTLRDFRTFLREAHGRGLKVITELVINHTSDQHAWFQRARRANKGSTYRDFYVWSDDPHKYPEARIIFKDFEHSNWAWDPTARSYYWHRFYSHQPDLNFDNPEVRKAVFQLMDFWFDMGVDGLRLDAVPYLFERDGTNCENLPETHDILRQLRRKVDQRYQDRMLLAEANQWPEDAVAYFGDGNECHMAFHFPVMPRLFMGIEMEDRFPIVDILEQTPAIPDVCQWAIFLRNHDELTLEMVTDEDRDYMYRVYAQDPRARVNLGIRRRLAPLMGLNRRRIELMNSLLLSLPGTPVMYYGDEIGMGDNIYLGDRNGVRTPMQWSPDRNAGFSKCNPQQLYLPTIIDPEYHYEAVNVEAQQNNPNSLLWWMKRIISLRKDAPVFGRGNISFLQPDNRKVLSFIRELGDDRVLVVANLSRIVQCVELDLQRFTGHVPVELFGRTQFPPVTETPYFLTLAPHAFMWFRLESPRKDEEPVAIAAPQLPHLSTRAPWHSVLRAKSVKDLERVLCNYMKGRRWFGGKARRQLSAEIIETIAPSRANIQAYLTLVEISYVEGESEYYNLPIGFATGEHARELESAHRQEIIARLTVEEGGEQTEGVLYDALAEPRFCSYLADVMVGRRTLKGKAGEFRGSTTRGSSKLVKSASAETQPQLLRTEQTNSSVAYGDRMMMKIFRRVHEGVNPDLEVGRFLTERTSFNRMPPVLGALEYRRTRREPITLSILHGFIASEVDAWRYTIDALEQYFERVLAQADGSRPTAMPAAHLFNLIDLEIPSEAEEQIGVYSESVRKIGSITADLHLGLATRTDDPAFAPESFSTMYQRSLYQSMRSRTDEAFRLLEKRLRYLPRDTRPEARRVLNMQTEIRRRQRQILDRKIRALRLREHGDYHLGQLLYTGKDFVVLDFEGEPARPLGERRLKRSPLRDVAGMLRSFHYASVTALMNGRVRPEDVPAVEVWADSWYRWVALTFLQTYVTAIGDAPLLPKTAEERKVLLDTHLLDKALYELLYELNNRPEWTRIPLRGILKLLGESTDETD